MTKLLDRVDTPATKGARKQAIQSHASMVAIGPAKTGGPRRGATVAITTGRIEIVRHGSQKGQKRKD